MTDEDIPNGTERCAQAADRAGGKYDIVVNIQGDEPLLEPEIIDDVIKALQAGPGLDGTVSDYLLAHSAPVHIHLVLLTWCLIVYSPRTCSHSPPLPTPHLVYMTVCSQRTCTHSPRPPHSVSDCLLIVYLYTHASPPPHPVCDCGVLPLAAGVARRGVLHPGDAAQARGGGHPGRGLHSLTSELNLRTFGTHRSR